MKIYITDSDHDSINIETEIFKNAGMTVELAQAITEDEIIEKCSDGEIFIVQYGVISERVMEAIPSLKLVVRYGVGVDTVDVEAATRHNIQVGNVPDSGTNEVADHALTFLLTFLRKLDFMNRYTKSTKWDYAHSIPVHRFSSLTVGVIGLGRIGRNFAKKADALGFNVIGVDLDNRKLNPEDVPYLTQVSFDELIEKADAITLHIPADGNRNLINAEIFKKVKNTAILINCARGGIVNEDDLYVALKNGDIAFAGFDCMLKEPMSPDSEIFQLDNFLVTPHMAWYSEEAARELKRKVAEEAVRFAKGEPIHYPVNHLN